MRGGIKAPPKNNNIHKENIAPGNHLINGKGNAKIVARTENKRQVFKAFLPSYPPSLDTKLPPEYILIKFTDL